MWKFFFKPVGRGIFWRRSLIVTGIWWRLPFNIYRVTCIYTIFLHVLFYLIPKEKYWGFDYHFCLRNRYRQAVIYLMVIRRLLKEEALDFSMLVFWYTGLLSLSPSYVSEQIVFWQQNSKAKYNKSVNIYFSKKVYFCFLWFFFA